MAPLHANRRGLAALLVTAALLGACSDGSNRAPRAQYDFSAVDTSFQQFLDATTLEGISYTLVDREQGTVHEGALGDHTLDTVVQLASTSKMPSASLLMALHEDEALDYDVETGIDRYLPWAGVHGNPTSVHLVSNTSGIPGLSALGSYGPHLCQFTGNTTLQACGEILYTVPLPGTVPPGTRFDYGGTQWHLAGVVAENVSNSTWNQAFDAYIGGPCELEVFTYGNLWTSPDDWNGSPDSLTGQANASIEGGAITNMRDYARILLMHLREGRCGDSQVLSPQAVAFMQEDRASALGGPAYGMGWWITPAEGDNTALLYDPGAFGAVAWLDVERGIGGYVAIDDYSMNNAGNTLRQVLDTIVPLQQQIVDEARAAAGSD